MSSDDLRRELLTLSASKAWAQARGEWELVGIHIADDYQYCLCGHYPIRELCELQNQKTGSNATVGNHCVKQFMEIPSTAIFDAIDRIDQDEERALNQDTIDLAYKKKWISRWDYGFYSDTWRKRILTDKQLANRVRINRKVLAHVRGVRA